MSAGRAPGRSQAGPHPLGGSDGVSASRGADTRLAIDVKGLSKSFGGRKVVNSISLQVTKGQIVGFLGPNGSGKTTTMRMLCGLLTPDAGEGRCLGLDFRRDQAELKRKVGYMTQKFGYYEDLSIRQNLDFVARLFELPDRKQRVDDSLEKLGLSSRQQQLAGSLSGGWKQRLALSACLMHEPELLLLDEPTAGVDPQARREFWEQLHTLSEAGITVLVATHYMDEAERCDELVFIAYGEVLAKGSQEEVLETAGVTNGNLEDAFVNLIGKAHDNFAEERT